MQAQKKELPIAAEVDLDEMDYSEDTRTFFYPCRCGEGFTVKEEELEKGVECVCCSSCSLMIRLLYQPLQEEDNT